MRTKRENKWKYDPKDFGGNGLSRRYGTIQQTQGSDNIPGCSPGG